jgi:hypothetical protein
MVEALIAGERDPTVLAELSKSRMRTKKNELGEDYYARRLDAGRQARRLTRQLEQLGYEVAITPAA